MAASVEELTGAHLWRGTGHPAQAVLPTGFEALDSKLGGGWPWGAVIEIYAERYGIGELGLWMPALASLSRQALETGWIAWVAPPLIPYAPALARHGVDLERVLLVQIDSIRAARAEDALWATEQVLRSGASAAVLAWLPAAKDTALRRLQLAASARRSILVLFRPDRARRQRSPAALRLRLSAAGMLTRVDILKRRGGRPDTLDLDLAAARVAAADPDPASPEAARALDENERRHSGMGEAECR